MTKETEELFEKCARMMIEDWEKGVVMNVSGVWIGKDGKPQTHPD